MRLDEDGWDTMEEEGKVLESCGGGRSGGTPAGVNRYAVNMKSGGARVQ